ncbi:MAG: hypothetical protein US83_C0002G0056 [Candidatus Falkowbacteria bacterium GW2011_GWC2_38_22]|uniref:DUF4012 domain-containing protein n=1 Tax=Candidatus Falkowbacteria bacterium GW2011_GWE1_38_31 TaxID=1618638 RepID=A0A0G0N0V6_9BACT|nr:MAG: hypothetical protein US73_C0007G0056 [Candidatus Falkowbacteria bacterium GW2011_GWF2_38_1205]KKQ61967.1 MAG: hypothetical protein US83_C0002G0056 [Candidatus Falkowbacteria bacterium GW2011_GWC2_38_22]KKQ63871.1 MAG: hypothetical protein US84_C0003G0061 [Candidatus Falkowbacteria bacterium GW2011_GWF1_38_22]KKQ66128.1 MAG: hypothetical protein US87_C0003G0061 [Candidatus Falkowbacteria bacterium GW2011_GWE2_38_254]KKQ70731.1 MAG: hypothetical protein US91_C0003G0061 [Candidatus Falkowb
MHSKKNKKVVYVNESARPSRFLVDLLRANEPKPEPEKNIWEKFLLHFKKKETHIKRLAFFSLFKALFVFCYKLFKVFSKICFWFGWVFLFVIRFFGISIVKIFSVFKTKKKNQFFESGSAHSTVVEKSQNVFSCHSRTHSGINSGGNPELSDKPWIPAFAGMTKGSEDGIAVNKNKENKKEKKSIFSFFKKSEPTPRRFNPFNLTIAPFRPLLNFIFILIVIILPLKAFTSFKDLDNLKMRVIGTTNAAISDIKSASQSATDKDFAEAGKDFSYASKNFLEAKKEIADLNVLLNIVGSIVPNNEIRLAKNADLILEAGRLSSEIGFDLSEALSVFNQEKPSLELIINSLHAKSEKLIANTALLDGVINKIDAEALPPEYKDTFIVLREKFGLVNGNIKEFFEIIKLARVFLGFEQDKRYLFVFQNNAELRASGGFIGSFAVVDFRNGEIINLNVPGGGSYDTEGGLLERIIAPQPLALVNPLWHFWDANWWPDWQTSAEKLAWFYEKSGGSTVDGVISFTPTVLESILKIIGPLDMNEKYGATITAENFWQLVQVMSEQKPQDHPDYQKYLKLRAELFKDPVVTADAAASSSLPTTASSSNALTANATSSDTAKTGEEQHAPKKIIGDMFEKIRFVMKENLSKEIFFSLAGSALESLNEKHILLYFNDDDLQAKADAYSWTGKMRSSAWDYLMVVHSNIAGAKTDRVINEDISHKTEVSEDGTITDTVEIIRRHNGIKGDAFTGVRNVDWLRVYVPEGSRLISASGFRVPDEKFFDKPDESWQEDDYLALTENKATIDENSGTKIYTEAGKTVFANWCMADPGETIVVRFKYVLPFKMVAPERTLDLKTRFEEFMNPEQKTLVPYALMAQKQPGTIGSKFFSKIILPEKFKVVWRYGGESGDEYVGDLKVDRYRAVLVEEK